MTAQHSLEEYKQAFIQFADAREDKFLIMRADGAIVLYDEHTYRVCHYDDLLWEFKTFFKKDLTLIYTETPFGLWEMLFDQHEGMREDDLIIDVYSAWKLYW